MIALQLTDKKDFMNKLLKSEIFDNFLLQEAIINNCASYVIDGHIQKDFYSTDEIEELGLTGYKMLPFRLLRTSCFDLIKGKKTPSYFKFVFLLSPENLKKTMASLDSNFTENDISGVFINLRYQNDILTLTTGISYNIFSIDKTLEFQWDKLVKKFLHTNEIAFEEL